MAYIPIAEARGFTPLLDKLKKYTSVNQPGNGWVPGCKSYKIWMDKGTTYQYYAAEKLEKEFVTNFNKVLYSESYKHADKVALDNFSNMHVDDPLYFEVGDLKIKF